MSDLTLEDVAKRTDVSRSTVSRLINDHPNLSENARRRVSKVIQKTVYRPPPQPGRLPLSTIKVALVSSNLLPPLFTLGVEYLLV